MGVLVTVFDVDTKDSALNDVGVGGVGDTAGSVIANGVGADPSVHAHVTDDFAAQIKYFSSNSVPVGHFMTALGWSYVQ
jgi:hypothetical protein